MKSFCYFLHSRSWGGLEVGHMILMTQFDDSASMAKPDAVYSVYKRGMPSYMQYKDCAYETRSLIKAVVVLLMRAATGF